MMRHDPAESLRLAAKRFAALAGQPGAYAAYKQLTKAALEFASAKGLER